MAETNQREIQKIRIEPDIGPSIKIKSVTGNFYGYGPESVIFTPSSGAGLEDFGAGETVTWFFPTDEWHYILRGEAEVTYSLAATSHTEEKTMHISPGDLYFIPAGARLTWKVAPASNLVHFFVVLTVTIPMTLLPCVPTTLTLHRQPEAIEKLK
jgi:hypothetical protein